jgi:hypothetical protein
MIGTRPSTVLGLAGLLLLTACGDSKPESAPAAASAPTQQAAPATGPAIDASSSASAVQTISPAGQADRLPPPDVAPVVRDGVRYSQATDGRELGLSQVSGVLVATQVDSGKRLWTLTVYGNPIDPKQEADVQWVFFKSMAFDPDGRLRIVNEAGQAFLVDVQKQTASPAP